ncbi:hypothetical protein E2C01_046626 [Portunus trituberculatus]|uniref:Uncharacterized protein n=1 Tax=Portunus trituberculatus TaxID=210409 RepID=A0A5B7FZ27_PORTR|nr:hypothetical protein [Portunus trituberculatus]
MHPPLLPSPRHGLMQRGNGTHGAHAEPASAYGRAPLADIALCALSSHRGALMLGRNCWHTTLALLVAQV